MISDKITVLSIENDKNNEYFAHDDKNDILLDKNTMKPYSGIIVYNTNKTIVKKLCIKMEKLDFQEFKKRGIYITIFIIMRQGEKRAKAIQCIYI
jgi:hypothetical protein